MKNPPPRDASQTRHPMPESASRLPWILTARPATLGLLATLAVALASTLVMIQPGAAEARVSTAIVSAVTGA